MDFLKRLFKPRPDDYEGSLRRAEGRLGTFERQLRKEIRTWQDVHVRRPNEISKARDDCRRRLLMLYSWAFSDILDQFYRSCVLLMKRALLRSLVDEAAIAALSSHLYAAQAWRKHLVLLADERARAAAEGQTLPLPSARATAMGKQSALASVSMDDLLPLDMNAFCMPVEEVVRTSPSVKRLQKRVARIGAALAESDASIRALLPRLKAPPKEARREALEGLLAQDAEAEINDAAAEGEFTDGIEALKTALVRARVAADAVTARGENAAVDNGTPGAFENEATRLVAALTVHPVAPWAYKFLIQCGVTSSSALVDAPTRVGAGGRQAEYAGVHNSTNDISVASMQVSLPPLHGSSRQGVDALGGAGMVSPSKALTSLASARGRAAFDRANDGAGHQRVDSSSKARNVEPPGAYAALDAWSKTSESSTNASAAALPAGAANPFDSNTSNTSRNSSPESKSNSLTVTSVILQRANVRPQIEWDIVALLIRGQVSREIVVSGHATDGMADVALAAMLVHVPTRDKIASLASIVRTALARKAERKARESAFVRLVADQRNPEGRLLQRWCDRVLASGFEGVYAFDMPRFMGFDPGRAWLEKERAALGIQIPRLGRDVGGPSPEPIPSTPALVQADSIDGTGVVARVGTPLAGSDTSSPVKSGHAPLLPSPTPSALSRGTGQSYSGVVSPAVDEGAEAAQSGALCSARGPGTKGGVPPPRLVNTFLAHFTRDLAQNVGLAERPPTSSSSGSGASGAGHARPDNGSGSSGESFVASRADIIRLLRGNVNALVYPRLHALLFSGVDIVTTTSSVQTEEDGAGGRATKQEEAAGAAAALSGVVSAADLAVASGHSQGTPSVHPHPAPSRSTSTVDMALSVPTGPRMADLVSMLDAELSGERKVDAYAEGSVTNPQRPPGSAADAVLRRDRFWLRKQPGTALLSSEEIGVPAIYFTPLPCEVFGASKPSIQPYELACAYLSSMDDIKQPTDVAAALTAAVDEVVAEATARVQAAQIAHHIATTGAHVTDGANEPALKAVHVTAEDLIPLLIFACSRSAWRRPHACLAFASSFAIPPGSAGGKEAYMIALLQSCIAWVCQRKAPMPTPAKRRATNVAGGDSSSGPTSPAGRFGALSRPSAATYDGPTLAFDAFATVADAGSIGQSGAIAEAGGVYSDHPRAANLHLSRDSIGSGDELNEKSALAIRTEKGDNGAMHDEEGEYDAEHFDAEAAMRAAMAAAAAASVESDGASGAAGQPLHGDGVTVQEAADDDAIAEAQEFDREYEELLASGNGDPLSLPGLGDADWSSNAGLALEDTKGAAGLKGSGQTAKGGLRALIAEQDAIEGALSIFG